MKVTEKKKGKTKMKKIKFILLTLCIFLLPLAAFADTGAEPEFFTWTSILTVGGATAVVALFVQLTKGLGVIAKIPTQIYSYIVAVIVLLAATIFTGGLTVSSAVLTLVNGLVVSLAANGAYGAIARVKN